MNIQNNILDLIPIDLLHEIFSRLPAKSVGRWRCVSKKLASILGSEDFKQLFLTRSLSRPYLLFVSKYRWAFYSLSQLQNEKLSLVLTAECPRLSSFHLNYASGLCLSSTFIYGEHVSIMISNPSTGQNVVLPEISKLGFEKGPKNFLGFDPIDKQFKILLMDGGGVNDFILTIGTGKMRWRTIKCSLLPDKSYVHPTGICINGVLYLLAKDYYIGYVIVCFDVRTETFKSKFLVSTTQDRPPRLINCKGKLGITILRKRVDSVELELDMWVVEDVEKPEWWRYTLPIINMNHFIHDYLSVVGMSSTGEIILSTFFTKPNYLYYFNLEKKSHQIVEVPENYLYVVMDHVEDLYFNDAKYFIDANPREAPPRESINTFEEAQCLSDEEDDD